MIYFYVSENEIAEGEEAYFKNGEKAPYPTIGGVPEQFVRGPGNYEKLSNGEWRKVES